MLHIDYPFRFASNGTTGKCGYVEHVRDLVEQVLFTQPGERIYRPDFGCGLLQMVFEPNSSQFATAVEASTRAELEEWLGELIEVLSLEVNADEEKLIVELSYLILRTGQTKTERFEKARYIV